jgi:uncharacterized protein (DUF1800 family)
MGCMPNASPAPRRRVTAIVLAFSLLAFFAGPLLAQRSGIPRNADAVTVSHVLNRIGFGPRPGDVEGVMKMGLAAYIEQQLHPEKIQDEELAVRLASFTSLTMSQEELAASYFIPAEEVRRQQQQKQAAQARANGNAAADPTMTTTQPPTPEQLRDRLTPEERMKQQAAQNVPNELMQAKVLRAVMSERQLEEVLVDFWFNHFNVFIGKGQVRQYLTEYERDAIRPYVLGNFRDLLGATAHSPAMLFYLDNFQSVAPEGAMTLGGGAPMNRKGVQVRPGQPGRPGQVRPGQVRPGQVKPGQVGRPGITIDSQMLLQKPPQRPVRGLNENYAREIMELHTLGVDGGYKQEDVIALARILTGWTIDRPQVGGSFVFRPQTHDAGEKVLLGTKFPAGKGLEEGERALDILAAHPSTAKHIAFQLAQRFVSDEPPQELVDRAAKKFTDTKGDLREVTRVIITSPEFFAASAHRAKVKTPFEFVVSAARAADANIVNAQPIVAALRELGMPLYGCQPPTGYSMTADAWVNTGSLLNRMNFALQLVNGGQQMAVGRGGRGPLGNQPPPKPDQLNRLNAPARANQQFRPNQLAKLPIQVDVSALAPDVTEASQTSLVNEMLAGQASDATKQTLARATTPHQLVALALGSPEFQRR